MVTWCSSFSIMEYHSSVWKFLWMLSRQTYWPKKLNYAPIRFLICCQNLNKILECILYVWVFSSLKFKGTHYGGITSFGITPLEWTHLCFIRMVLFHGSKNKAKCVNTYALGTCGNEEKIACNWNGLKIRVYTTDRSAPNKASVLWKCMEMDYAISIGKCSNCCKLESIANAFQGFKSGLSSTFLPCFVEKSTRFNINLVT